MSQQQQGEVKSTVRLIGRLTPRIDVGLPLLPQLEALIHAAQRLAEVLFAFSYVATTF
jgi:hypothetical protein